MRSLIALLTLTLLLTVTTHRVEAKIVDSNDWIVKRENHSWLDRLTEVFKFPNPEIPKNQAVVGISVRGLTCTILIVGPISGDAQSYAKAIDGWRQRAGLPGDVLYSQEDDCAAATYAFSATRIWQRHGELVIPINAIVESCKLVEPSVFIAFTLRSGTDGTVQDKPDFVSESGARYWNLTERSLSGPDPLVSLRTDELRIGLMFAWFLWLPLATSFTLILLKTRTLKPDVPIEVQRKQFGRVFMGGVYGGIGSHALLTMGTLPTKYFDPVTMLWFGSTFSRFALPLMPVFLLMGLAPILVSGKIEKKLFGPTLEERVRQEELGLQVEVVVASDQEKQLKRKVVIAKVGLFIAGVACIAGSAMLPKTVEWRDLLRIAGFMLVFIPGMVVDHWAKKARTSLDGATEKNQLALDRLTSRLAVISARTETKLVPELLDERTYDRYSALSRFGGIVGVSPTLVLQFSDAELDFILAHEAAHQKLKHLPNLKVILFIPLILMLPMTWLAMQNPRFLMAFPLIAFPLFVITLFLGPKRRRMHEFEADAYALSITLDKDAACSALVKVTLGSAHPGMHESDALTHPAIKDRLASIQNAKW